MPTDVTNVCLSGKTRSGWRTVKTTRLTQSRPSADAVPVARNRALWPRYGTRSKCFGKPISAAALKGADCVLKAGSERSIARKAELVEAKMMNSRRLYVGFSTVCAINCRSFCPGLDRSGLSTWRGWLKFGRQRTQQRCSQMQRRRDCQFERNYSLVPQAHPAFRA